MKLRHAFVAGVPRSGTTALAHLLNQDPRLVVGIERFKKARARLDPYLFTESVFFSPLPTETDMPLPAFYGRLRERWDAGAVEVIGDKVPLYTRAFPLIARRFPTAIVMVTVRDLAEVGRSFAARAADPEDGWPPENDHRLAARLWKESVAATRDLAADPGFRGQVLLVPYARLMDGDPRVAHQLASALGLSPSPQFQRESGRLLARQRRHAAAPPELHPRAARRVEASRDAELEAWVEARVAEQDEHRGPPGPPEPGPGDPDATTLDAEHAEIQDALLQLGVEATDANALAARLDDALREIAKRGDRLRDRRRS